MSAEDRIEDPIPPGEANAPQEPEAPQEPDAPRAAAPAFLSGGGEMGALMRAHDWSRSSLGPPSHWPQPLRTVVRLMLNTGHPMYIWWGPDLACLYNDAYRQSIGPERHPGSLGRPAREVWDEIWDIIGPQIDQVLSGRGATWNVNHLVPITRHGRRDEVYWTYSYSPIDDETAPGGIGGVLVLCTETTQQVQNEARFRELAEQLSIANRLKDEFLATLAHELRNPLAPISNAVELLRLAPDDPEVATSARDIIGRQLGQLVRLIDDLLDLSRVSRGIIELRRTRLALSAVLRDAIETSRPLIWQAGHALIVHLPEEEQVLEADPTRIVQVFSNLLNNAAKFTPRGGKIELGVDCEGDGQAVVWIRDNGMGIPQELLSHVFEMFAQVDRSHAYLGGGLGIGLTLARRLVEMHGGSVEARSEGEGAGSEFRVRLPLAPASTAIASPEEGEALAPIEPAKRRRIVVADDNVDAAQSLAQVLRNAGHEASIAHDGEEALALAHDLRPDVMVLDIAMPGLDGHELARRIRAEPWGDEVLLIAASGWGQAENKQHSQDAGFDYHLVKPIALKTLDRLLRDEV